MGLLKFRAQIYHSATGFKDLSQNFRKPLKNSLVFRAQLVAGFFLETEDDNHVS